MPYPLGAPLPKRPCKGCRLSSLPQSKTALPEPPRTQPLATVPAQGGHPPVPAHRSTVPAGDAP
jgi:hypothetical protein